MRFPQVIWPHYQVARGFFVVLKAGYQRIAQAFGPHRTLFSTGVTL